MTAMAVAAGDPLEMVAHLQALLGLSGVQGRIEAGSASVRIRLEPRHCGDPA